MIKLSNSCGVRDRRTTSWAYALVRKAILRAGFIIPLILPFTAPAQEAFWCPEFTGTGLDYNDMQNRGRLNVVERVHFTEDVRTLRRGATSYLARDIEFVLNVFPNHPQALDALSRLAVREGASQPGRARADIECRFQWAIERNPQDAMVRVIRGIYYHRVGRHNDAREQLRIAVELAPENPEVHYNLGLVLVQLRDFENARIHAAEAYSRGYPLPGLRNLLSRAGHPLDD